MASPFASASCLRSPQSPTPNPFFPTPISRSQSGFTLLEVLIAFSLLAIGIGLLLSILSGGVHAVATASDSTRASLYAEGLLDELGADARLQPGRTQGQFEKGRYRWTLDVRVHPLPPPAPPPGGVAPIATDASTENQLLDVDLVMTWNGGASGDVLRVQTLRAYMPPQVATP
ncbi:MAG: prepilin-type N-terminal cleavage/methylation domain-containing protein [Proteobacteria bacterium]|nr:prepilin-type N-terminal cleavage/methylation domain-containing protein [Pseudomonadota bacterium]